MLRACYLGWQGWLFQSDHVAILVDPLLVDEVGRGGPGRRQPPFVFWPPREFDWSKLPPIDAVFFSHEHEDHFNIESLAQLSRDIPVLGSTRMSAAGKLILRDMGFTTRYLSAGEFAVVGDLELRTFAPDLVADWAAAAHDEWDVLAFLVRHTGGDGVFFSNVDVAVTRPMAEAVDDARGAGEAIAFTRLTVCRWQPPEDFTPRTADDQHAPPPDALFHAEASDAQAALLSGPGFRPLAGQCVLLEHGAVTALNARTPFVWTAAPPWPPQPSFIAEFEGKIAPPVTGIATLEPGDFDELTRHLRGLAEYLYGRELFRRLNSLSVVDIGSRRPTFLFALIKNAQLDAAPYEYDASLCQFSPLPALSGPPTETHVGIVWGWAADVLAMFRGEIEPRVAQGWVEHWHEAVGMNSFWESVLWPFFHPLRHPAACLIQYRRAFAAVSDAPPHIASGTTRLLPAEAGAPVRIA